VNRSRAFRTAGETAALLGVSSKALRVYERHGLITPDRSSAGYRVYGPTQMRQLHQVLALKSLGLSLAQIGKCLAGLGDHLGPLLKAQEAALRSRIATLQTAVGAVVAARMRLAAGMNLTVDDLVTLSKEIVMTEGKPNWRHHLGALIAKHMTEAERHKLMAPSARKEAVASESAEREELLTEVRALVGKDPSSPEALDLARRWRDRALKFAGEDHAMLAKLRAALDDALANPDIAETLPWRDELAFIRSATQFLEAAGQ
jgi:MerR family transcriptional regulator, thiopeptide resistance regulator